MWYIPGGMAACAANRQCMKGDRMPYSGKGSSNCTSGARSWELDCKDCLVPGGGCVAQLKQLVPDDFSCFAIIMRNISLIKKCHLILINYINI